MNKVLTGLDQSEIGFYERGCPYNGSITCTASLSAMLIDEKMHADCCGTENYDDCPIFLAKVLRKA
jgi:hypothetical protein